MSPNLNELGSTERSSCTCSWLVLIAIDLWARLLVVLFHRPEVIVTIEATRGGRNSILLRCGSLTRTSRHRCSTM